MDEMKSLRAELDHYKAEKEKIRDIVGQIGGNSSRRRHTAINAVFLVLVLSAFVFDVIVSVAGWHVPYLPPLLLLEMAVLLVSLKIIWMIHGQSKVEHFQFWILHSIEFQMNMLSRRIAEVAKAVEGLNGPAPGCDGDGAEEPSETPAGEG